MGQLLANGVIVGCTYALVGFGFALIYNTTRTFHFAHGAIYTFSAYVFYTSGTLWGWPAWLAIVSTLAVTALLGVAVNEIVYRPLLERESSSLVRLLSSLGAYIIIVNIIVMIYGNEVKVPVTGFRPEVFLWGGVSLSRAQVMTAANCLVIFVALLLLLRATRLGRVIRAMRDDPELVSTLGINPHHVSRVAFALGSALVGVAAILKGVDVGVDPNSGMAAFLGGAVAVIVGGVGIFEGVILSGIAVGVLQSLAVWRFSAQWQDAITFLLLILFLLFRPQGILGRRRRVEVEGAAV